VAGQLVLLLIVALAPWLAPHPGYGAGALVWRALGGVVAAAGALLGGVAGLGLGASLTPLPYPRERGALVVHGAYAWVRHPIYVAVVLLALGWSGLWGSGAGFGVSLLLALWLDQKARREERWLAARWPEYRDYQRRVGRWLPRLHRRRPPVKHGPVRPSPIPPAEPCHAIADADPRP
jgi:protein-S-isoprenylcysteine O-methyltransferase Ste14